MAFTPPTIEESGGLQPHIDKGVSEQNGHDYNDFVTCVGSDPNDPIMPIAKLARRFNKNPKTVRRWLEVMKGEVS